MAKQESELMNQLMLEASQRGNRLWRNNQGRYQDKHGTWITYGVCNPGGSDLIGFTRRLILPEHVGSTVAVFTAVEAKTGRLKPTADQDNFIRMVVQKGGIADWGTDAATLLEIME